MTGGATVGVGWPVRVETTLMEGVPDAGAVVGEGHH
jgi:hypothetical protein